jgi:Zn-dependent protease with chaperone function
MIPDIQISKEFKASASKSIFAIIIFIMVYLALVAFAIGLTIACAYAGIAVILHGGHIMLIVLGAALVCLGFFVLFFLIKFIFASSKEDVSHLTLITAEEQPKLFAFIQEIVDEVGTHFPKKIYLSNEVNAYVFYNSNFWSMFFPVKKNLCIGLGLVNAITVIEMKSILAHEFGHFSQRSMKVGSFVYNVNKVIYNMLYQNTGYGNAISTFSSVHGIFSIVAHIAVGIVRAMQWIMQKMYAIINKQYMSLSRQMEFHADEVAANVAGSAPLANTLLRLELAELSFNNTINYYNEKIGEGVKTANIFPNHQYVLGFLAKENNIPLQNNLPFISIAQHNQFNTSKLVVKNQWASHPSTIDRVVQLERLHLPSSSSSNTSAWDLFTNNQSIQETATATMFAAVTYNKDTINISNIAFEEGYDSYFQENNFNPLFNAFYNNRNLQTYTTEELATITIPDSFTAIFTPDLEEQNKALQAIDNDMATMEQISQPGTYIKTFDYAGKKYSRKDIGNLTQQLTAQKEEIEKAITESEKKMYLFFYEKAVHKNELDKFNQVIQDFTYSNTQYEDALHLRNELYEKAAFIQTVTPVATIKTNFEDLKQDEIKLVQRVKEVLASATYSYLLTDVIKENFEKLTTIPLTYFMDNAYIDEELKILFNGTNDYFYIKAQHQYKTKKAVLDYWAALV